MKKIKAILTVLIAMPIWYYLLYQILTKVEASELMWFLYWIYLPAGIICQTISKLIEKES